MMRKTIVPILRGKLVGKLAGTRNRNAFHDMVSRMDRDAVAKGLAEGYSVWVPAQYGERCFLLTISGTELAVPKPDREQESVHIPTDAEEDA